MSEKEIRVRFHGFDSLRWGVWVADTLYYESRGDFNCCAVQSIGDWSYDDDEGHTTKEIYRDFLASLIKLHDEGHNHRVILTAADAVQSLTHPSLYGFCMKTGWHHGPAHLNPKSGNKVVVFETNINHLRKLKI